MPRDGGGRDRLRRGPEDEDSDDLLEEFRRVRRILEKHQGGLRTFPWDFSTVVNANAGNAGNDTEEVRLEIPYDGTITRVIIGWAEGANQAVGVSFKNARGEGFIPRNEDEDAEFIALTNHVLEVELNVDFEEDQEFIAEYRNNDDQNDHFVNMIVMAREGQ